MFLFLRKGVCERECVSTYKGERPSSPRLSPEKHGMAQCLFEYSVNFKIANMCLQGR